MNLQKTIRVTEINENVSELIAAYQPQLKSYIHKRVTNKEDAEDILQDVFHQLIKTVETSLNPIEHVSAWLYRVAHNLIINKGIKKKELALPAYRDDDGDGDIMQGLSDVLFQDASSSPEMEYLRSLVWTELETALAELPPEQRKIYELTELEGIPVKDISETTGIAVNTLLSRKHYAVLHLRKRLVGLYHDIMYS
ncbi:RNA polymerase subunit sigma-24 [Bacteroidia bacterium]|nr:RNA polymerase subunit sigma-24 [Bacteroidia bacterium]